MKILMIMDPGILVPPKGYGGIERMVDIFAKEYVRIGHEVHLLVTTGSGVEGCIMHPFGRENFPPKKLDALKAIPFAWKFLRKHRGEFDLIHNFGRLAYLIPVIRSSVKKIMTYEREIRTRNIRLINSIKPKNMVFTACSANLLSRLNTAGNWEVVYNAVEFSKYSLQKRIGDDAPLIFLGRVEKIKGCHTAIRVAKATGNKLIIAGNISTLPEEIEYYEKKIKPHIDGKQIVYVGPVNDEQKNTYLGMAKAMLFPIEWNEPFGIVMIESMACGTPVVGFNKGSVSEVIDEGITGCKMDTVDAMINCVNNISSISREGCRLQAQKRFDIKNIASQFLEITSEHRRKILIITSSQPSSNPRVIKEYDALIKKRNSVKVLYTYSAPWCYKIDQKKFTIGALKKTDFIEVGGNPFTGQTEYFVFRVIYRLARLLAPVIRVNFIKNMGMSRATLPLWLKAKRYKADIYIAHYLGALPAAVTAAKKNKARVIFDAEDFHRGEELYYPGQTKDKINFENRLLPKVNAITTASPLITQAYKRLYPSRKIFTINNCFSKAFLVQYEEHKNPELNLFWFSQNVGVDRGLELIVDALNILGSNIWLHLLGNIIDPAFGQLLLKRAKYPGNIKFINFIEPDSIFGVASKFDIGLAAEIPRYENRNICLTNKIFTYLLAGNCILASDTDSQKQFMEQYPEVGMLYAHDDAQDLAAKIKILYEDRRLLNGYRCRALELADKKLNWENESQKMYAVLDEIDQGPGLTTIF